MAKSPSVCVERTYWSGADLKKDTTRLERLGYRITDQVTNDPYLTFQAPTGVWRPPGTIRKRVPIAHVTYSRSDHGGHDGPTS